MRELLAPGVVIDISDRAAVDVDATLAPADLEAWEARNGPVPDGAMVLLRTGWSARWPDAAAYLGDDTPGDASNLHFPGYGEEATRILVEERGVVGLGIDTASIDPGPSVRLHRPPDRGGGGRIRGSRTSLAWTSSRRRASGSWLFR